MTALLASELRRMSSRRLVRVFAALALLGIIIAAVVLAVRSTPPATSGYFIDRRFHLTALRGALQGTSVVLVIAAWVLASSFVGADWNSGMMTTELTWEPRRVRLLAAKAVACMVVLFVLVLAFQAVLAGALTVVAVLRGVTAGADAAWARDCVGIALRVGALSCVGGSFAFAVAAAARNTAGAQAVGFGYAVVVENLIRALRPGWTKWLVSDNAIVFVARTSNGLAFHRSATRAGLLLGIYAAAALAAATLVFQARDVT